MTTPYTLKELVTKGFDPRPSLTPKEYGDQISAEDFKRIPFVVQCKFHPIPEKVAGKMVHLSHIVHFARKGQPAPVLEETVIPTDPDTPLAPGAVVFIGTDTVTVYQILKVGRKWATTMCGKHIDLSKEGSYKRIS